MSDNPISFNELNTLRGISITRTIQEQLDSKDTDSLTENFILVGDASNLSQGVAMSGEASIVSSGAVTLSNAAVIAKVLTGYVSGAGSVSASDSILSAVQKLNGNAAAISTVANAALPSASFTDAAVTGKLLTGYVSGSGTVAASDSILQAVNKLNGNSDSISTVANAALPSASFTDAAVTAKILTGLAAGANTPIAATDTILVALANLQAQIDAL